MKISIKAILIGAITDVGLSILLGILFSLFVMRYVGVSVDDPGATARVIAAVHSSAILHVVQLVIGIACSIIGGYVASRISKSNKYLNSALASWLCVGIGVYSLFFNKLSMGIPLHLLLITVTPLFYIAGAYLQQRGSNENSISA